MDAQGVERTVSIMKNSLLLLLLLPAITMASISQGNKFFAKGEFAQALVAYEQADSNEHNLQVLHYNKGTAHYQLKNYESSLQLLKAAAMGNDSLIRRNAMFNLANVHFRIAEAKQKPQEKIEGFKESIALLKSTLMSFPNYENAKRNIEIIQRRLKEELDKHKKEQENNPDKQKQPELSDAAKEALARALQLAQQKLYQEAKTLLEGVLEKDDTAERLRPYVQRLQDILDISAGRKPARPIDNTNADQELEVI
jgi:tetratricopeptide (TPR) repeat protein